MLWITRSHVHVEQGRLPVAHHPFHRFGCAGFLFVPKSKSWPWPNAKGGHYRFDSRAPALNHDGDLCTFDVIIRNYNLTDRRCCGWPGSSTPPDTEPPG